MTDTATVLTTPFPLINGAGRNRITGYAPKLWHSGYSEYGQTATIKCVTTDYASKFGTQLYFAGAPGTSPILPAATLCSGGYPAVGRGVFYGGECVVRKDPSTPLVAPLVKTAAEPDMDAFKTKWEKYVMGLRR